MSYISSINIKGNEIDTAVYLLIHTETLLRSNPPGQKFTQVKLGGGGGIIRYHNHMRECFLDLENKIQIDLCKSKAYI